MQFRGRARPRIRIIGVGGLGLGAYETRLLFRIGVGCCICWGGLRLRDLKAAYRGYLQPCSYTNVVQNLKWRVGVSRYSIESG